MPAPLEPLAVEQELEMTLLQAPMRIAYRGPAAAIPDNDRAAAILAFWDIPLELQIIHRMIFGLHRQALLARNEARTPGHGPALEHAVELETQVVMQPPRGMFLHHELPAGARPDPRFRFRGSAKIPFLTISLERIAPAPRFDLGARRGFGFAAG